MPRFFFHVEDHALYPDDEGTILDDLPAARLEAVRTAGAILKEEASQFWQAGLWRVVVTDEHQTIQFSLCFEAVPAPNPPRTYDPTAGLNEDIALRTGRGTIMSPD